MIKTSSDLLRSSLAIFGDMQKMFGNIRLAFGTILENLPKSLERGGQSSKNRQKQRHQHVYNVYNKKYIKHQLKDNSILALHIFSPLCNILYIIFVLVY